MKTTLKNLGAFLLAILVCLLVYGSVGRTVVSLYPSSRMWINGIFEIVWIAISLMMLRYPDLRYYAAGTSAVALLPVLGLLLHLFGIIR